MAAVERSIALSPVMLVRDGTYRSFIPFACYVRGFASGAWSWRRPGSGAHVGGLYWDTVQSADALGKPRSDPAARRSTRSGALSTSWKTGCCWRTRRLPSGRRDYDPDAHWFAHAGWQYQPGLERQANIHLAADDVPSFLRTLAEPVRRAHPARPGLHLPRAHDRRPARQDI